MAQTRKSGSSSSRSSAGGKSKKTGGKKSTKRNTTKKAASGSRSNTKKKTNAAAEARRPSWINRRSIGLVLGILALLLALSIAGRQGFVITPLWTLACGLIGWGVYLLTVVLALDAVILMSRLRPYRLRAFCLLLLPVLWSAVVQSVEKTDSLPLAFSSVGTLWASGVKIHSAGAVSGMLAILAGAAFSRTGARIILVLLLVVCVFAALSCTPWGLVQALTRILEEDPEEEPEYLEEDDMTVTPLPPRKKKKAEETAPAEDEWQTGPAQPSRRQIRLAKSKQKKAVRAAEKAERAREEAEEARRVLQEAGEPEEFPGDEARRENSRRILERDQRLRDVMPQGTGGASASRTEKPKKKTGTAPAKTAETEPPESKYPDIDRLMDWDDMADPAEDPEAAAALNREKKEKRAERAAAAKAKLQQEQAISAEAAKGTGGAPYIPPSLDLLNRPKREATDSQAELESRAAQLIDTLDSFGIEARIIDNPIVGPTVTRFELQIERGVKISRITSLTDDLGLALGSPSIRISMVPEKGAIGIEVANRRSKAVTFREVIASPEFMKSKAELPVALGKDITGRPQIIDLAKMPHLMIAGTTGSGKSVCINSILISLLYRYSQDELRLIMIDPKMVELSNYNGIPHLLSPVVTDARKASGALSWAVKEMDRRYALFAAEGVRKMEDYNSRMRKQEAEEAAEREKALQQAAAESGEEPAPLTPPPSKVLPQIVIVIDELADLMMVSAKEVEGFICRLAQKARAAGMYLVVATQRPSADVITGLMKSNIPSRIAFAVASGVESRIIIDSTGAEKLLGRGDMLYHPLGAAKPVRIQGCFISTDEIERVIQHVKSNASAETRYSEDMMAQMERAGGGSAGGGYDDAEDEDPLLQDAIGVVVSAGQASTSLLQRRLKLGYARAARVMDQMEERGIVGPSEGSKPRQVLISKEDWMEMQLRRNI